MATLKSTTILRFLLFVVLVLSAASPFLCSAANSSTNTEAFRQCLLSRSVPSSLIISPNTNTYTDLLQSTARNLRFLSSPAATKPFVIVQPTKGAHVQATVVCSLQNNFRLRVRSGGHDYEGMSYVSFSGDSFAVLDLSNLRSITVDYVHGTAWVQSGATVGELYYSIAKNNNTVGFPAGTCPTIGIGGHLSGGGIGMIARKFGTSADNIVDVQIIDASGRFLTRRTMGEDYFWAIRGGGAASFGVVLAYKVNLVRVPQVVTAFNIFKTLNQGATDLVDKWQRTSDKFDENLFIRLIVQTITDGQGQRTVQVLFSSLYLGDCNALVALMQKSFPELGMQSKDCSQMSWIESGLLFAGLQGKPVEALLDRNLNGAGSFKDKSDFVTTPIPKDGLQKIWNLLLSSNNQPLILILEPFGGKMSTIPESAIAFPHRKGNIYEIQYVMSWGETDPSVTQGHLNWMKQMYAFMTPYVSRNPRAAYYNYKDIDLGKNDERNPSYQSSLDWGTRYFKNNFRRLAQIKGKVDPLNFFRNEQTIPPLLA